ncbi:Small ribosomal subunit protein uS17B [Pleurotus pulmonarius]
MHLLWMISMVSLFATGCCRSTVQFQFIVVLPNIRQHPTKSLDRHRRTRPQDTMAEQIEKAYQKQHLFQNAKIRGGKKVSTKEKRWYKDVGLGFKTPADAINGTYIDKKCPFTGDVSIRGRILTGKVVSTKMTRTIIIRRDYLHYIPKYNRYEKRHKNLAAHVSPAFRVDIGDVVTVGQCRPLSKTVRFNVLRVSKSKAATKSFAKF